MNAQIKARPSVREVSESLCALLSEGVDVHQCAAARALKRIGDVRATQALTDALLDEDEDVRTDAAVALVGRKDTAVCRQLLENLIGDPCGEVKLSAIDALVVARDPAVVPWLRRLVVSADEDINWDEDGQQDEGWDDWTDIQLRAIAALGEMHIEAAVPDILTAIVDDQGQDVSEVGCKALAKLGTAGTKVLLELLDQSDERYRRRAAACLAALETEAAASGVLKALKDEARAVRLATGRILAARDPGDQRLELLLLDPVPQIRLEMVRLCGASHPQRLGALLDDTSPQVVGAVVEVLIQDPTLVEASSAVPPIYEMFAGENTGLAGVAAQALAALDPQGCQEKLIAAAGNVDAAAALRIGTLKGLARIGGDAAIQALTDVLGGDHRQVRLEAISLLLQMARAGEIWPNPAGDVLLEALGGELVPTPEPELPEPELHEQQRAEIAPEAAAGDPASGATLESLVQAGPGEVADAFPMSTLASIMSDEADGTPAVTGEVQGGFENDFDETDLEFLGLAQGSAETSKKRVALVPDVVPHTDVQLLAARLLGDLPRAGVADALARHLSAQNDEIAAAAADSLAHLAAGGESFSPDTEKRLIGALTASDRSKRLSAIRALADAGSDLAVMSFINLLKDPDSFIRTEAIRALVHLDAVAIGVRELLDDSDPSVRLAAAAAVAHLGGEDAVETLGRFALGFEGRHGLQAAGLIRKIDQNGGNAFFLRVLADENQKRIWQVAIEALAELNADAAGTPRKLHS